MKLCLRATGYHLHYDHTVLPVTRHKWTHPALTTARGRYLIYPPRRDGRLSWPWRLVTYWDGDKLIWVYNGLLKHDWSIPWHALVYFIELVFIRNIESNAYICDVIINSILWHFFRFCDVGTFASFARKVSIEVFLATICFLLCSFEYVVICIFCCDSDSLGISNQFSDQELISYRYSSCSCCWWGDCLLKKLRRFW